jgi:hypothetical protein
MDFENKIVTEWLNEFTERIRLTSGSRKTIFTYKDAVQRSIRFCSEFDKVLINYVQFIQSNPLKDNDYFKYVQAYRNNKVLNIKYFRHDVNKLKRYYEKADKYKDYNPFSRQFV